VIACVHFLSRRRQEECVHTQLVFCFACSQQGGAPDIPCEPLVRSIGKSYFGGVCLSSLFFGNVAGATAHALFLFLFSDPMFFFYVNSHSFAQFSEVGCVPRARGNATTKQKRSTQKRNKHTHKSEKISSGQSRVRTIEHTQLKRESTQTRDRTLSNRNKRLS
jgi:hypothetical protein